MNKAKLGALWDDAVVEEGLAWRHPSAIPCDRLAGWERYRETAGRVPEDSISVSPCILSGNH